MHYKNNGTERNSNSARIKSKEEKMSLKPRFKSIDGLSSLNTKR